MVIYLFSMEDLKINIESGIVFKDTARCGEATFTLIVNNRQPSASNKIIENNVIYMIYFELNRIFK